MPYVTTSALIPLGSTVRFQSQNGLAKARVIKQVDAAGMYAGASATYYTVAGRDPLTRDVFVVLVRRDMVQLWRGGRGRSSK